jgi:hypothetical protein
MLVVVWLEPGLGRHGGAREDWAAGLRLQVNCPCDNLNNCPGLQEGIREVLCPVGLCFHLLA